METVDTLQTSGQSQKYFPAQLVVIIVHELFRPACLFSSDSHRAKAAGPWRLAFADVSWTAGNSVQDLQQNSTAVDTVQEGVHRVNISQSPQTGQSLSHIKRFCDFPCFYTTNGLRKKSYQWLSPHYWSVCEFWQRKLDPKQWWCLVAIRN